MAFIGALVARTLLDTLLLQANFILVRAGKVRQTYSIPDFPQFLLMLVTDRISIFDFVLGFLIPGKGETLVALTIFWHRLFQAAGIKTHLVAYGKGIDQYLPEELRGNADLQKRAIIVRKLEMIPVEAIVRGYLTGSGWAAYKVNNGVVCGVQLPAGLHDGSKMPYPHLTPTSKAEHGHDEHIDAADVARKYPWMPHLSIRLYEIMASYALQLGMILADTKFEFGVDPETGEIILGDEYGTPDSSRWWLYSAWLVACRALRAPAGWDKQPIRDEGKRRKSPFDGKSIDQLDPDCTEHTLWASEVQFSSESIADATRRNTTVVELLTGRTLADFQRDEMGVAA